MTIRHTISIPDPMSQYIDLQITSGLYGNISEYIRDLIRRDQIKAEKIAHWQRLVDEAYASGISERSFWHRMKKLEIRIDRHLRDDRTEPGA